MWSLDQPDAIRGRKYKLLAINEAAQIDDLQDAWEQVIRPTLTDYQGGAWFAGTPKGQNYFWELWQRGQDAAEFPDWKSWRYPTSANPHILPAEIEAARSELTTSVFEQEYLADFNSATDHDRFLPSMILWDACKEDLPPPVGKGPESSGEPMVLAADAGVTNDFFAVVGVTRHPDPNRKYHVAVRLARVWKPPRGGGEISFAEPEAFIREICKQFNVTQFCYDPYMLVSLGQRFAQDRVVWPKEFSQAGERLEADKLLLDLIMERRLAHSGDPTLREHVDNADRKPDIESRKLRIVKREGRLKIDACVALSMACKRILDLPL
jgi:hypothetical protein